MSRRANGDISLILSKSGPENPSVDEIIAVEKYITGYACKGNEPTVSYYFRVFPKRLTRV
jgi:hypothetical protein